MNVRTVIMALGVNARIAEALQEAARRFSIIHVDHWMAQMYVESIGFTDTTENWNYRPEVFLRLFKGRNGLNNTLAECKATLARGADAIFESIYGIPWGKKRLGNTQRGDGAKFPGKGFKQLTGRDNVTRYSLAMYGDDRVAKDPSMLTRLPDSAMSAAWFWHVNKIDAKIDAVKGVKAQNLVATNAVNGGTNGLQQRENALLKIRALGM